MHTSKYIQMQWDCGATGIYRPLITSAGLDLPATLVTNYMYNKGTNVCGLGSNYLWIPKVGQGSLVSS